MTATSKVDAIQAAVMKSVKAALAEYEKRNRDLKGNAIKPPEAFVEKVIRSRLNDRALVQAFVDDALAQL